MCMGLFLHVCLHTTYVPDALYGQKNVSDLLEVELQTVWATMRMLGIEPRSSKRTTSAINYLVISLVYC